MRVAVLGGGFQGCCTALALSMRGVRVTLFDRSASLMSRTAIANEGKVHLGYMYAADRSLATAKTMSTGALAFGPFLSKALEVPQEVFVTSQPAAYVIHRDSQCGREEATGYLRQTHSLIAEKTSGAPGQYFGQDLLKPLEIWNKGQIDAQFDPAIALAVIQTPEIAIDPIAVMAKIRQRIESDPLIEVRLGYLVEDIAISDNGILVQCRHDDDVYKEKFVQVINSLWEGRLGVDAKIGLTPARPWLYRLKYGISIGGLSSDKAPPSCTIISGPFGEVVTYPNGTLYLTWYPHCVREYSSDITPPFWETHLQSPLKDQIVERTIRSMSKFIRQLNEIDVADLDNVVVKGGPIFAWGKTDIHDPDSELHRRYDIGVYSTRNYHTVDPGKLTMAPFFADVCAERVLAFR